MQVNRVIDSERGFVFTTITGEITVGDVLADIERLAAQPSYRPEMPGIVDMRQATTHMTAEQIEQIAQTLKKRPNVVSHTRRALLVSSDLLYGLYRMFESFADENPTEYRVFRDENEARAWIGAVPVPKITPA